jgi:membrane protein DedA with SNARE-associated domain
MHISADTLQHLLDTWGYVAVAVFVMIECFGIPFPGETMLLTAAAYAGAGHLRIPFVIGAAAVGAICGDNGGYWVGRTGGRSLVLRYGKYIRLDARKLQTAEAFYARHGDKTVFFGRFVSVLRAWNSALAGLNRMFWPKFFVFDAAGAICWATLWGILAFEFGRNLPLLEQILKSVGIGGVALVVLIAVALYVLHRRRHRQDSRHPEQATGDESKQRRGAGPV